MNLETLSATVETNKKYTFTFKQYVVDAIFGFSNVTVFYPEIDHHIKEIEIDLRNFTIFGNQISITPHLHIIDNTNHSESNKSSITIVVLAVIGTGNCNISMFSCVDSSENLETFSTGSTIKTALLYSKVRYAHIDHHVHRYMIAFNTYNVGNKTLINAKGVLNDCTKSVTERYQVMGSLLSYAGDDNCVLCTDFDSSKIQSSGIISFGKLPEGYNSEDFKLACFINEYDLSFVKDNHLYKFDVSVKLVNQPFFQNGELCVKVELKSNISDYKKCEIKIPNNKVKGFVVAFNDKYDNKNHFRTLEEFANNYNFLNSKHFAKSHE